MNWVRVVVVAAALMGPFVIVHGLSQAGPSIPDADGVGVDFAHGVAAQTPPASDREVSPSAPPVEIEVRAQVARPSVQEREQERPRRSRWSSRNRYPGPIPTPEEWEPPEGPVRIGVQVGHWRTEEAPRELNGLRSGGTSWRNTPEWVVNLEIAERTVELLRDAGYEADLLPAVVPPSYRAHLFIAVHSDGSNDPNANGFRVAAPSRDATGRASQVVRLLERSYGEATGITRLPTVTRRMRNYYAFNFRRYEHALHPMTIGVILETGFLTSERDRRVIMDAPERAARGIVDAVKAFPVTHLPETAPGG